MYTYRERQVVTHPDTPLAGKVEWPCFLFSGSLDMVGFRPYGVKARAMRSLYFWPTAWAESDCRQCLFAETLSCSATGFLSPGRRRFRERIASCAVLSASLTAFWIQTKGRQPAAASPPPPLCWLATRLGRPQRRVFAARREPQSVFETAHAACPDSKS